MIHLISDEQNARPLLAAFELDENLRGEIHIFRDDLGFGPLMPGANQSFDETRTNFRTSWNKVEALPLQETADIEALLERLRADDEPCCFWMAPNATDVCRYFWLLPFFKNDPGRLHTIAISGLPFLNDKGQLFYPTHFAQIPPKEFIKTKRLLKEISPAEFETEGDEWLRLQRDETGLRGHEGGKKIVSKADNHIDAGLLLNLSSDWQKASKALNENNKKNQANWPSGFVEWRIRTLIEQGQLELKGDPQKTTRELEIRNPNGSSKAAKETGDAQPEAGTNPEAV
jgi:hypothetical protein